MCLVFYRKYGKRIMDVILSLSALIVLSPVMVIVSLLIKIKLGSPIFFQQERPGLNGEIFKIYKFRTMKDARDENGELLPDDIRFTEFGNFLRNTSLDEIPEFFNILKGDMSMVGPRPLRVEYLPYYNEREQLRHSVLPGLTGLAQVNGRNSICWEEKFAYDVRYVESISFVGDIAIIMRTVKKVFERSDIGERGVDNMIDFNLYRQEQSTQMKNE